jgi:3-deoxy-manno-octulosonate cytidylyltransferase (CMP-KDO synthetase)
VYERVVALGVVDACVVATDSEDVVHICREHDVPVELTRTDHPSGSDRIAEVMQREAYQAFDVIVNVQGDEPFVSAEAVAGAVAIVRSGVAPIGTASVPLEGAQLSDPSVVKVVTDRFGRALYFSRATIPAVREADDAPLQLLLARGHVGVYAFARAALAQLVALPPHPLEMVERLEQLRALAHGIAIGVAPVRETVGGIDTEHDLDAANERWERQHGLRAAVR